MPGSDREIPDGGAVALRPLPIRSAPSAKALAATSLTRAGVAALLASAGLCLACAQTGPGASSPLGRPRQATLVQGVRLFDGAEVVESTNVLIIDGKIARVGPTVTAPAGATLVDGRGHTLLPGFIDAHTHTWTADHLRQAVSLGVTTELDMMGAPPVMRRLKAQIAAGELDDAADLRSAGNPVTVPGGHATEYGLKLATVTDPANAAVFVTVRVNEGSDYIKLFHDDRSDAGPPLPTLGLPLLRAAIQAAHDSRRRAVVHAGSLEEARAAVAAGADGLTHLWRGAADDTLAEAMRARDAFVVATLSASLRTCSEDPGAAVLAEPSLSPYVTRAERRVLSRRPPRGPDAALCDALWPAFHSLRRHGVALLVGSDTGNPGVTHGATVHVELEQFVRGGMTPVEALAAATSLPALHFGLDDRGRIVRGARADLILVAGDPTRDIRATRNIVGVYRAGLPIDRAAYLARLPAPPSAAKAPVAELLVGDFEAAATTPFDPGWAPATDREHGGLSVVSPVIVAGGAGESAHALRVEGNVLESQVAFPLSGMMYSPGPSPMQPTDLSGHRELAFHARGDGGEVEVLFYFGDGGQPARRTFVTTAEWTELHMPFADFDGSDGTDVAGIFIGVGRPGRFWFELDRVILR